VVRVHSASNFSLKKKLTTKNVILFVRT